ncbi:hypothetical protein ACFQU3_19780 [Terrabacter sp. GCM10028922]|uniref:hypothetical protein n=1 Tax=Terrabacter sp. GCM10028922 TaxID=3273428 RepID=UPI003621BB24
MPEKINGPANGDHSEGAHRKRRRHDPEASGEAAPEPQDGPTQTDIRNAMASAETRTASNGSNFGKQLVAAGLRGVLSGIARELAERIFDDMSLP